MTIPSLHTKLSRYFMRFLVKNALKCSDKVENVKNTFFIDNFFLNLSKI